MRSPLYKIIYVISLSYCLADPILPSYERDEGDWPIGVEKSMSNVIDRWFIDINDAKCKPLEYRGIKGNYNNFASKGLCEMHGRLTQREKLQGCKKPKHPGHCVKNSKTEVKYHFNPTTAKCETFHYNGCGGSFNRYKNADECYLYCLNKKNGGLTNADDTKINEVPNYEKYLVPNILDCTLRPDVKDKDPSTGIIADTENNKCAFAAVSIDSNTRGIFKSFGQCVKKSHSHDDTNNATINAENKKVAACKSVPFQHAKSGDGNSETTIFRYYYDSVTDVCKRMETGPATDSESDFENSKNSFPTMEMCHSYCGAGGYKKEIKIEETCKLGKQGDWTQGAFKTTRYYYSISEKKCISFCYKGYDGNSNNFKSSEQCQRICGDIYNEGGDAKNDDSVKCLDNS